MRMLVVLVAGLLVGLCGFRGGYQAAVAPAPVLGPPAVLPVPAPILQLEKPRGLHIVRMWVEATSYEPSSRCCGPHACGITATGVRTAEVPFGVASDWRYLPPGTRIRVPGYHGGAWVTIDDSGGQMRRDGDLGIIHIDVRERTWTAARRWGVQFLWVDVMVP